MPTIYDNINTKLQQGLKEALSTCYRVDISVGYFNLRGWNMLSEAVDNLPGEDQLPPCRLIIGMPTSPSDDINKLYVIQKGYQVDAATATKTKKRVIEGFVRQLQRGIPTSSDEKILQTLRRQLEEKKIRVKLYTRHPLHAKLYLGHRSDRTVPVVGFLGSSNLTLAGLKHQGELNVDVTENDAAAKLKKWFDERWDDQFCIDISDAILDILKESWAQGAVKPYYIYLKTAYHISQDAIGDLNEFFIPHEINKDLLDFQKQAVQLATQRLNREGGVLVGDVVGLGKTRVASAIAKICQEDHNDNVLVICPPKLENMWKDYIHKYDISGITMSLGKAKKLEKERRYRLVIIDESHHLRNRRGKRYGYIKDYINQNDSRVVLLTATPYNTGVSDISSQLALFIDEDRQLNIRPERLLREKGLENYKLKHQSPPNSLGAFEHSPHRGDWQDLMKHFMVRRTRSYIKNNYAKFDKKEERHYLTFSDGKRFYFPKRTPLPLKFQTQQQEYEIREEGSEDQYAKFYSKEVVDIINDLHLARYGLQSYIDDSDEELLKEYKEKIELLSNAGKRLRGFARVGLFKRLESSGPAFIISVRRHISRNQLMLYALKNEKELPIGTADPVIIDEFIDEQLAMEDSDHEEQVSQPEQEKLAETYKKIFAAPEEYRPDDFMWLPVKLFTQELADHLREDNERLQKILKMVPQWNPDNDRKLEALQNLCFNKHQDEKVLIFSEFKHTVDYLHKNMCRKYPAEKLKIAKAHGDVDNIQNLVKRFSPISNEGEPNSETEIRILISTDTLSDGQNLQDAHIIVNFDIPWAIVRLIQRAGRVDRIGQQSKDIYCYSAFPEEGIERIIRLRSRIKERLKENGELIGSDEQFSEDDKQKLQDLYESNMGAEEYLNEEAIDDTDIVSRAYQIWKSATDDNEELRKKIVEMPNVVYSARHIPVLTDQNSENIPIEKGAIVYIKSSDDTRILARLDKEGEMASLSQSEILDILECDENELPAKPLENHHEIVQKAVKRSQEDRSSIGGNLGTYRTTHSKVYERLKQMLQPGNNDLLESASVDDLHKVMEDIYQNKLTQSARRKYQRQLRTGISDNDLIDMLLKDWQENTLCNKPKNDDEWEAEIICSMSLIKPE